MSVSFVHLHLHTEYSLADGMVRVAPLMDACLQRGMPAVALTDLGNVFAMVKFYRAAEAAGIKPILGADLQILDPGDPERPHRLVLLCQDRAGYANLTRLITRSYTEGQHRGVALVHPDWFAGSSDGLIALSGGRDGDVGRSLCLGREDEARARLERWRALFGDRYYLELVRTGREDEAVHVREAARLAAEMGVGAVASNDVRFIEREDFQAHEARVCIHDGYTLTDPRRPHRYSDEQYLRSPEEMAAVFPELPEALANSVEIARRCNLELRLGENFLPAFPVPEGKDTAGFLREESRRGLAERFERLFGDGAGEGHARWPEYQARLERELEVIEGMGFPGYFLIVADFIRWARENGVPVGPGRGSGAGSLVAFVLGITDLDPLRYDLLFERFLNPERVSMPDFDVDFCMEGRDRVIDYVAERYGRDRVSQIITYGTMAARAVVRDVGRILGHPYGFTDRVAKLIPFEVGMTLDKALDQDEELKRTYEAEEEVRQLIDFGRKLEGITRNAGKHAGGVVIAPSALTDFTPLYCEEGGGSTVTQFDKDDVEAVGLVKFDFLGLRTLTIIDRAVRAVNADFVAEDEPSVDIERIPLDDAATYALLKDANTTAVFQLESRGMKDLIKRLRPDNFEEIIALVALFRPGPLQSGMVDDFIQRKHGQARIQYPHPSLEAILRPTYGVILYQEQVMQIAQSLAGYTLGGADLLRRAMGKKKPEEMAKQRSVFMQGAARNGVDEEQAITIFDLIEKFAGYGFNKSHSAAYALLSYQTAWLKAHYPAPFMAAVLSSDMDHTDKVVTFINDCREQLGLSIDPPDVNRSDYAFKAESGERIVYGLGAIKGVGRNVVEEIVRVRGEGGAFRDLDDLCSRMDSGKLNRRVLEALVKAGALDGLGPHRAASMEMIGGALAKAEQASRAEAAGQEDMFGIASGSASPVPALSVNREVRVEAWDDPTRLRAEKETLGLWLSGHPIQTVQEELRGFVRLRLDGLSGVAENGGQERRRGKEVMVAGVITEIRRRGGRVSLVLDDNTGRVEVTLFDEVFQRFRNVVVKDSIVVVEGRLSWDEFIDGWRITVKEILDMDQARARHARWLELDWEPGTERDDDFVEELRETLLPYRGGTCEVRVRYRNRAAVAPVQLGANWRVHPQGELIARLSGLAGEGHVRIGYPGGPVAV